MGGRLKRLIKQRHVRRDPLGVELHRRAIRDEDILLRRVPARRRVRLHLATQRRKSQAEAMATGSRRALGPQHVNQHVAAMPLVGVIRQVSKQRRRVLRAEVRDKLTAAPQTKPPSNSMFQQISILSCTEAVIPKDLPMSLSLMLDCHGGGKRPKRRSFRQSIRVLPRPCVKRLLSLRSAAEDGIFPGLFLWFYHPLWMIIPERTASNTS